MSKANRKTSTTPTLRPFERVTFIPGMSTGLRSLFGDWQAEVIATKELYRQREAEGATHTRLDAITNRSRRMQDKIEDAIFRYPLHTMEDALAIGRFAETLNKGGDIETATRSLRRVNNFIERSLRVPAASGPLASLYGTWMETRKRADAAGHAGNDDEAGTLDAARDKVVDLIAGARATSPADIIVKLRVLRWGVYLLAEGDADREAELRMIDGLILDMTAAAAQPGVGDDGPLIAACADWHRTYGRLQAAYTIVGDETSEGIHDRLKTMADEIAAMVPWTPAGFAAQLGIAQTWHAAHQGLSEQNEDANYSAPDGYHYEFHDQAIVDRVMRYAERFAAPASDAAHAIAAE